MAPHPQAHLGAAGSRSGTATPTAGSQTITATSSSQPSATLRLRGASPVTGTGPRVQWAEDVIDNEGMGKKSSKVCCIYHKPHEPGDSDGDSSSSSDEDSDSEPDLSRARRAGEGGKRSRKGKHDHDNDKREGSANDRKPSPNAYERQPKYTGKGKAKSEG